MAYCKNCGAYIPDGQTKCLACGLEQNSETSQTGSGYAKENDPRQVNKQSTDDMRRRLDEQRKKQQEDNKRWAEAESQRRQQQSQTGYQSYNETSTRESEQFRSKNDQPNKVLASLSYLPMLFVLPFIFCKNDRFAMFHAKQGAILSAATAVCLLLSSAFGLSWIVKLMYMYMIYKGMTCANNNRMEALPYIGKLFSKQD
jgi:uncharacterized membrane protein/uncharacterized Zn finger protein (UPF0148 family)